MSEHSLTTTVDSTSAKVEELAVENIKAGDDLSGNEEVPVVMELVRVHLLPLPLNTR